MNPFDRVLSRIRKHKAVFDRPSERVPSDKNVDGPLLGNGDVGIILSGPPERLRFSISKNDFWKSKPGFPNGGPRPIGGLDLIAPSLQGASYHVEVNLASGELVGVFSKPGVIVELRAWVAATQNVLVVETAVTAGPLEIEPELWVCTGDGSTTSASPGVISRRYEGQDLAWPCQASVALKRLGNTCFVAAIASSFESADPTGDVVRRVEALYAPALEEMRVEHGRWWAQFWSESWVDIHDDLIERHYYGAQYILASCSRNPGFPPGLWGNWTTTDAPAWAGDYHLNYNHQAPFWGLYGSNHLRLADGYDAPLLEYLEPGKRNAKAFLGVRGIYYEVGIGPRGFCSSLFREDEENPGTIRAAELECGHQFWGQKSNALFGAVPMILRWHHTLDLDYARRVYPYLIEVANFWEDYLSFEKGRYVIHNDCYNEAGPWEGPGWEELRKDFNPLLSLGLLRCFLAGLLEISTGLARDMPRQEKWRHILEHLSALPLAEQDGRRLPCGAERGVNSRKIGVTRLTFHGTVWPASIVGQNHLPEYYKILKEEAAKWGEEIWVRDGNSFDTVPPGAARLGLDPVHILKMMRAKIEAHALPNLWIVQSGGGIETCGGITAGINEMLLQSYEGEIRLFPCWPANQNARFANLRAWGAFLVSAELKKGVVQGVRILSEKGTPCQLANPWPGFSVRLVRNGRQAEILAGERLHFSTAILEEIELVIPESTVPESGEGANVSK